MKIILNTGLTKQQALTLYRKQSLLFRQKNQEVHQLYTKIYTNNNWKPFAQKLQHILN